MLELANNHTILHSNGTVRLNVLPGLIKSKRSQYEVLYQLKEKQGVVVPSGHIFWDTSTILIPSCARTGDIVTGVI